MAQGKQVKPYEYFDTPDGEDMFKKLWCVLKPMTIIAGAISTVDVFLWSHPKGYAATIGRYLKVGLPLMGIASTFVLATNVMGAVRKTDDKANWFMGGFAAGSCVGLWTRRPIIGFNCGMALGIIMFLRKECQQQGWELYPDTIRPMQGGIRSSRYDFSWTAERPRNWVTGKE